MPETLISPGPALSTIVVDLADMKATNNPAARLTSNVLGACVALAIYDPVACVGGLLHFISPESALDRQKALGNPFLFADTGIPMLFRRCYKLGAVKERIVCRMAGGGSVMDRAKLFNMGQLNQMAAREVLSKNNVSLAGEQIGGRSAMAISLYMDSGRMLVKSAAGEETEI